MRRASETHKHGAAYIAYLYVTHGLETWQIQERLGVSKSTVLGALNKAGIRLRQGPRTLEHDKMLRGRA